MVKQPVPEPVKRKTTKKNTPSGGRKNFAGRASSRKSPLDNVSCNVRSTGVKNRKKVSSKKKDDAVFRLSERGYYILMALGAMAFVVCFYFFFIRPYSYRWKPCYGMKAYGVCLPYGYNVHGIDVSHHQGNINWTELKNVQFAHFPVRFVFMKATEGGDFKDKAFDYNFKEAGDSRFIRGAYHFYNPNTDPVRQADFFIDNVNLVTGDLPPVLDIEKRPKDVDKMRRDLKIWLNKIESHYKVKPILYTSYKFKTKYLNDSVFDSYPYWIAHYYVDSVRYDGQWKFWQHTDVGTLPGIRKQVDLNVFNGTMTELMEMTIKDNRKDMLSD